jgi:hypothetical protein
MARLIGCLSVVLLAAMPLRAGELDREFGPEAVPASAVAPESLATTLITDIPLAGELDAESPTQAWGWGHGRRFGFGIGWGRPWGGWGWGGGWGSIGWGRPWGGWGWGGGGCW